MVDQAPQFEVEDRLGTTDPFTSTVGTSWTAIPASPGTIIQSFTVISDSNNDINETLEISLDNGTTVMDKLYPSGSISHLVKGEITQIYLKGFTASVDYKVILNRELN